MTLWSLPLREFRELAASARPTPGGGSVAAVCGALGASLVAMALEISLPRAAEGERERMREALDRLRSLIERIGGHADTDVAVFERYMAALALPKESESERRARSEAVQRAVVDAAEAPLRATHDLLAALEAAIYAAGAARKQVLSDVLGGADLLGGAAAASLRTFDINLPHIDDADRKHALLRDREALAAALEDVSRRIPDAAASRSEGR